MANSFELSGTLKVLEDLQTFASGFTKREMVVTVDDGRYPQDIALEFVKDKIALLEPLSPGQEVTVSFDIRTSRYREGAQTVGSARVSFWNER